MVILIEVTGIVYSPVTVYAILPGLGKSNNIKKIVKLFYNYTKCIKFFRCTSNVLMYYDKRTTSYCCSQFTLY